MGTAESSDTGLQLASGRTSWTARLIVQAPTAIARACRTGPFARRGEASAARHGAASEADSCRGSRASCGDTFGPTSVRSSRS